MTVLRRRTSDVPDVADAFADWVRPHLSAMTRLAARLAPEGDRDGVVQEALARAWRKRRQFDAGRGPPAAWLPMLSASACRTRVAGA